VGKVVQPLQSVNCHDSRAHGHEWHGPFTRLVGVWLVWFKLSLLLSSWFGSWYAAGAKPMCMVLDSGYRGETYELCSVLATGVTPVSFGHFGYRGETCELYSVLATGVRLVSSVRFWLQG
jgi:hypothetical protein